MSQHHHHNGNSNGKPISRIQKALHETIPGEQERAIYQSVAIEGRFAEEVAHQHKLPALRVEQTVRRVQQWIDDVPLPPRNRDIHWLHLQRLDHQWHEAMTAWYRSGQTEESTKVTREQSATQECQAATGKDTGKAKVERATRNPCGDVRYLEQARKILAEYRNVRKEAAELRQQKEQQDAQSSPSAQREQEILEQIAALRQREREAED